MPTSTHPTAQTGMPPRGGGRTLLHWVSISLRRGGRPCPPAGIVWFYGNPMRIRNILTGRCGHRPLQTTAENRRILKGGQSRPPLQPVLENRVWVEKSPRFPFHPPPKNANTPRRDGRTLLHWVSFSRRRGRCLHRPIPPPKRECPRAGAVGRYCIGFRFRSVGADDPVRPRKMPVFVEIRCEFATF